MYFPENRMRRLRQHNNFRRLIRETNLSIDDMIFPLFVTHGKDIQNEISAMPGNYHFSIDKIGQEAKDIEGLGIPAVILFGLPESKDEGATEAYDENGIVQQAIKEIKDKTSDLLVITDVCLCEYTSHGHCGIVVENEVDNDITLELLAKTAISHAEAGADMLAPSDMMDGRVATIRLGLDESGFKNLPIMSYAAKYSSSFYGPFREAADSAPQFGDRRSYQMDPPNVLEALREVTLDIEEGADIIMVKPALSYLDVITKVKEETGYPLAAYSVSGEFSMVKAAAANGWIDEKGVAMEILTSIKRAGADCILTYFAKDVAGWLA